MTITKQHIEDFLNHKEAHTKEINGMIYIKHIIWLVDDGYIENILYDPTKNKIVIYTNIHYSYGNISYEIDQNTDDGIELYMLIKSWLIKNKMMS